MNGIDQLRVGGVSRKSHGRIVFTILISILRHTIDFIKFLQVFYFYYYKISSLENFFPNKFKVENEFVEFLSLRWKLLVEQLTCMDGALLCSFLSDGLGLKTVRVAVRLKLFTTVMYYFSLFIIIVPFIVLTCLPLLPFTVFMALSASKFRLF